MPNKRQIAETDGEQMTACPIVQFHDRITNGFWRLASWHLRRREGDGLPCSGIASLTRSAASDVVQGAPGHEVDVAVGPRFEDDVAVAASASGRLEILVSGNHRITALGYLFHASIACPLRDCHHSERPA